MAPDAAFSAHSQSASSLQASASASTARSSWSSSSPPISRNVAAVCGSASPTKKPVSCSLDLSAALDCFGDWGAPAFRAAVGTVLEAGESTGVPVGTLGTSPEEIRTLGDLGFDFLVAGVDFAHLVEG